MANVQNDLSPILFTTQFYFLFSLTNNSHLITPILTSIQIIFKKGFDFLHQSVRY